MKAKPDARSLRSLPSLRSFRSRAALAAASMAALCAASFATPACDDGQTYVYSAQKYDRAADCLAGYAPVETVNGAGAAATCEPMCLTVGEDLYVSTMCPPLPAIATAGDPDAGPCAAALAAAKRGGTCDAPPDASDATSVDAAEEPAEEAGPDATEDAKEDVTDAALPKDASDAG